MINGGQPPPAAVYTRRNSPTLGGWPNKSRERKGKERKKWENKVGSRKWLKEPKGSTWPTSRRHSLPEMEPLSPENKGEQQTVAGQEMAESMKFSQALWTREGKKTEMVELGWRRNKMVEIWRRKEMKMEEEGGGALHIRKWKGRKEC